MKSSWSKLRAPKPAKNRLGNVIALDFRTRSLCEGSIIGLAVDLGILDLVCVY